VKRWPDATTLPSDDCELTFGDEVFTPHAGETVTFLPGLTVGALLSLTQLAKLAPRFEAMDDATAQDERVELMSEYGDIVAEMKDEIAGQIVEWTWTDRRGRAMPSPADDPNVIKRLEIKELMYLGLLLRGESKAQEGKGSRP